LGDFDYILCNYNDLMAYVYRHIRLDKNEPFYIGIGSDDKYYRAGAKSNRNKLWKDIVAKTDYEIEILFNDLTWDDACKKEQEFIALYGRKNKNKGSLCNLTDGGEGAFGVIVTQEKKDKLSKKQMGKIIAQETKDKISNALKGKKRNSRTIETKLKISKANKGKIGLNKGKKMNQEFCMAVSLGKYGKKRKPFSDETKLKMKQSALNRKLNKND